MGYYLNEMPNGEKLPASGKVQKLLMIDGAELIEEPQDWEENIVCVVDNGPFEAAAYAYSKNELEVFKYPDGRPKKWLKVPGAKEIAK